MASATVLIVLACLFIVSTKVYSELENERFFEGGSLSPADEADAPLPQIPPITGLKCIKTCFKRCKFNWKCFGACITFCNVCKCVPRGSVGDNEECSSCYTDESP